MATSLLSPNTCGFAKVVALELSREVGKAILKDQNESHTKYLSRVKQEQFKRFQGTFTDCKEGNFTVEFKKFQQNLPALRDTFNKWNCRKAEEKISFLETFSGDKWQKLSLSRKKEHSFSNCKGCAVRYANVLSYFPVKSSVLKGKAKANPVFNAEDEAKKLRGNEQVVKPTQKDIITTAKAIYDKVAPPFEKEFKTTLAEALSKIPELNLQLKTKNERRQDRRNCYKKFKENVENQAKETSFLRCYGGGQSLSAWQRNRLASCFETKKAAKNRRERLDMDQVKAAKIAKKNHSGDIESMTWDKEALKAEVEGYEDSHEISWRELATRYDVCNKAGETAANGGQIVHDWLISQGVDLARLKTKGRSVDTPVIRRRKRRGAGGEITIPTEVHPTVLKQQLIEKVQSGEYTIGEIIVPRKYEKLVMTKDAKIKKVDFTVEGRKTTLEEIRHNTLAKHKDYMRRNPDDYYTEITEQEVNERLVELNEFLSNKHLNLAAKRTLLKSLERTRNLLVWHDNSTVANHGYLACLITCLYDPAIFYTNEEYMLKAGKAIDIQKQIEQPELHFIARCGSSDHEQLMYSETRLECVQTLKQNITVDGINYRDVLRFGHGDNPMRAFEIGQQKGGNYFCSTCGIHCSMTYDIDHALNCQLITLQERKDTILQGTLARRNTIRLKPKPLNDLTKDELEQELASRGIYEDGNKKTQQDLLTKTMRGKQRVPALIFNRPLVTLDEVGLDRYEVLPTEPLHDIGHHIENFFTEFPRNLTAPESKLMDEAIELCLGGKDSKRTVDYRAALVKLAAFIRPLGTMKPDALKAIDTLVEMQRILYAPDNKRTPALILRYYNQSWYHAMILNEYIKEPKKLTLRKMFGVYFHDLSAHAGIMLRLISGQAANAEEQERVFNHIKRITKRTSNYHPGQIIPNLFIRLQAEKEMGLQQDDTGRQQTFISTLSKCLPPPSNTRIPIKMVKRYSREWQAHLQQIGDFLLEGEGVWWSKDNEAVEFHDVTKHPSPEEDRPPLHHFRSSTLSSEEAYLKQCWNSCLRKKIAIPCHVIRTDSDDGRTQTVYTGYLGDNITSNVTTACQEPSTPNMSGRNDIALDNNHLVHDINPLDDEDYTRESDEEVIDIAPVQDEIINLTEEEPGQLLIDMQTEMAPADEATTTNATVTLMDQEQTNTEQIKNTEQANTSETQLQNSSQVKYALKTRLGMAIEVVIGNTEEVIKFDQKYYELRTLKNQNKRNIQAEERYKDALAPIQAKILSENTKLHQSLVRWEKDYVLKNNFVSPSYEVMKADQTCSPILKRLKYSKKLLSDWKIDFS